MIPSVDEVLQSVASYTNNVNDSSGTKPHLLGTIDPSYISGLPKIKFDGESVVSEKRYPCLNTYYPQPNDRVVLAPVGTSYVILGRDEIRQSTSGIPADTTITSVKAYATAGQTFSTSLVKVSYNTPIWIGGGIIKVNATDFEVPYSGVYGASVSLRWLVSGSATPTLTIKTVQIADSSSGAQELQKIYVDRSQNNSEAVTEDIWLEQNQRVSVKFNPNLSTGALTLDPSIETSFSLTYKGR